MKASVKDQWVKDLRSGEFEQGNGYLHKVNTEGKHSYCCLGVLCEQAVKAGVIPAPELHGSEYRYLDDGGVTGESFSQVTALPRKVSEWAGNVDEEGRFREDVTVRPETAEVLRLTAIGANDATGIRDGVGLSFAEIADLIDANVPAE